MTSLDLISFRKNVNDYIRNCHETGMPLEAIRLSLKEIIEEVSKEAVNEAYAEASQKEAEKGDEDANNE